MPNHTDNLKVRLGSESPIRPFFSATVNPTSYAAPARFSHTLNSEELALVSRLAAQVLDDPIAVQRLCDRVLELMQQDLTLQRDRDRSYGRRW